MDGCDNTMVTINAYIFKWCQSYKLKMNITHLIWYFMDMVYHVYEEMYWT